MNLTEVGWAEPELSEPLTVIITEVENDPVTPGMSTAYTPGVLDEPAS